MASNSSVRDLVDFFAELEALANRYKGKLAAHEHFLVVDGMAGASDGIRGERKRKRTTKDPNAPKRPMSSYLLFSQDARKKLKKEHPDFKNTEIMSKLAEMWESVPDSEKRKYEEKANVLKMQYKKDVEEYHARASGEVPPSPSPNKIMNQYTPAEMGNEKEDVVQEDSSDDESSSGSESSADSDDDRKSKSKKKKKKSEKKKKSSKRK